VSIGFNPADFWDLTDYILTLHFKGASQRFEREHNERAWLAWHIAYLPRTKKPVKLNDMLSGKREKRQQTVEEQVSIAMRWTAALAGKR
jgi:Uri superfamily endonuclease